MTSRPVQVILAVAVSVSCLSSSSAGVIDVPGAHSTIGAAVKAASSGDTVRVGPGTFKEHLVIDKPLTLQGSGPGKTILVWDGHRGPPIIQIEGKGAIRVGALSMRPQERYVFDKDKYWGFPSRASSCIRTTGETVVLEELDISTGRRIGVDVVAGQRVTIRRCRISNSPAVGIHIRKPGLCRIGQSELTNCWFAVHQAGGAVDLFESHIHHVRCAFRSRGGSCQLSRNLIEACLGVDCSGQDRVAIRRNMLLDVWTCAFKIEESSRLEIAENVATCSGFGIDIPVKNAGKAAVRHNWLIGTRRGIGIWPPANSVPRTKVPPVKIYFNTLSYIWKVGVVVGTDCAADIRGKCLSISLRSTQPVVGHGFDTGSDPEQRLERRHRSAAAVEAEYERSVLTEGTQGTL